VIVVDVNLLIYAYNAGAPQHDAARRWAERTFTGSEPVRIPWAVVHAFLRLTTAGPFMTQPFEIQEATDIVGDWFAAPAVRFIDPGPRYWQILRALLIQNDVRGKLVSDAHIAALALENDATLYAADRDFARFAGLRVANPLV
jgi:toxin-antitoxin system PIN domain toxin